MIPFLFRTDYIMKLWLCNVPEYAVSFAKCIVFTSLIYSAFEPIRASVLATKRITQFMLIPNSFYIVVLPVTYIISVNTNNSFYLKLSIVLIEFLTCCLRIYYA